MRKISANYIFPVTGKPLKNGIIIVDEDGEIIDIIDTKGVLKETDSTEFYNGIIVPGFVNAHCHLELSFLRNKIPQKEGITKFVNRINNERNISDKEILESIVIANNELKVNGIVAVGDISNNDLSFETKRVSDIYYHTFIEVFGAENNKAKIKINIANKLKKTLKDLKLSSSIVPHSTYSVSKNLLSLLQKESRCSDIISIHNSESLEEINLFKNKQGDLYNYLKTIDKTHLDFLSKFETPSEYILETLNKECKIISVHNIFLNKSDIRLMSNYFEELYWCFCPNSNLYIEDKLPNIDAFYNMNQTIVLGTDSLASNTKLSILEEMKTITDSFPLISFTDILSWATINGAKSLNLEKQIGSLKIGKKPGLNLIENFNFVDMKLTKQSEIRVLV